LITNANLRKKSIHRKGKLYIFIFYYKYKLQILTDYINSNNLGGKDIWKMVATNLMEIGDFFASLINKCE